MTGEEALKVLVALGDAGRFEIFRKLQETGEMTTAELNLGKAASTMSHHLKKVVDAGLVEAAKSGKQSCYMVRRDTFAGFGRSAHKQAELATFADLTKSIEDQPL